MLLSVLCLFEVGGGGLVGCLVGRARPCTLCVLYSEWRSIVVVCAITV